MFSRTKKALYRTLAKFFQVIGVGVLVMRNRDDATLFDTTQRSRQGGEFVHLSGTFVAAKPGYSYVPDYFLSTRHKQVDIRTLPEFGELAREVIEQGHTLLGYDRLYTIYQSLQAMRRLAEEGKPINIAEIGVFKGGTSRFISMCANVMKLNARLHSFDTFEGHDDADITPGLDRERVHMAGMFNETNFDRVKDYLKDFPNVILFKGRFQDRSAEVAREQFHFVHSDVDLYEPTCYILDFMAPRLASKGLIVVDDYGNLNCPGIIQAVEEFLARNRNFMMVGLLTGQCVLIKD